MPSTFGGVEVARDPAQHLARERAVLALLGVQAQPGVVRDAVCGGALRLEVGELAEVVLEAVGAAGGRKPAQKAGSVTATQPVSAICT